MSNSNVTENRRQMLLNLVNLSQEISTLKKDLSPNSGGSDDRVILQRMHLVNILSKYSLGLLKHDDIVAWANLIEGRDDVGYEPGYEETIKGILLSLADPEMQEELSAPKVEEYFRMLGG
jgi:hypothetical protein